MSGSVCVQVIRGRLLKGCWMIVRIDSDALTPEEIAGWAVVIDIEESATKSLKMKECYRFNQKEML